LAASYDVFTRLLTPHLHAFADRYPAIELELVSSTGLVDLGNRQADLAVRLSPKPPEYLVGREVAKLGHGVYASKKYLSKKRSEAHLILWQHEKSQPEWMLDHFADGRVVLRATEIMTMMEAVKNDFGIARMPCYVGDAEPSLRRLDLSLTPSKWGVWVLSHPDLRTTSRVRACREFLIESIEQQRSLIQGLESRYA